jgi:hypothetical protein
MDQPRLSLADVRQLIQIETERLNTARQPPPVQTVVEYVTKDPELKPESPGKGLTVDFSFLYHVCFISESLY